MSDSKHKPAHFGNIPKRRKMKPYGLEPGNKRKHIEVTRISTSYEDYHKSGLSLSSARRDRKSVRAGRDNDKGRARQEWKRNLRFEL